MFSNNLKIAWRNLMKHKGFAFINISGLTIGITVCMMIFLYIMNEFSFDRFHANGKNIYRVMRSFEKTGTKAPYLSGPYARALANDFPAAIKAAVRVMPSNGLITFGEKSFNEKKLYITDSGFFTTFSFRLLRGDAATVLKDPSGIVLTASTAKRYFGEEDPIGKEVTLDKEIRLKVTGIAADVPSNSHLDFDLVMPITRYNDAGWLNNWMNNGMFTYLQLKDGVDRHQLEQNFPGFVNKYLSADMARFGTKFGLHLTPLQDIYFEPASAFDNVKHGDRKVVYIFISISALILLIACINFMNLSTMLAVERSREVGLRKVMGALRNHLVWQFIGESVLLAMIACFLSLFLLQLAMPLYNMVLGHTLTVSWHALPIYLLLAGVIIVVGFLAGSYPAFFLSSFSPIQALKGKLRLGKGGARFRQALVVLQFSISVLLIIGTIVIIHQMNYVKNKSLGYDKEQSVIIRLDNNDIYNGRNTFKAALENESGVASVSLMSGEPGGFFDIFNFEVEGRSEQYRFRTEFADAGFMNTLGLTLVAGRNFSGQFKTDSAQAVLINRTAASRLGLSPDKAIGLRIRNNGRDNEMRTIVGVVEDFNFLSLKETMDGLVISPGEDRRLALVKLQPGNIPNGLATVEKVYKRVAPSYPFEYSFLDEQFATLYKADLRQQTLLLVFAVLAILIACLGLFGLASFTAAKRTKEIGVRKVLGSSTENIVILLTRDLLKPVLLATVIAIPIGWTAMDNWLQNFAYRVDIEWWIFAAAGAIAAIIALVTVSFQAIRAAIVNPVRSLRTE